MYSCIPFESIMKCIIFTALSLPKYRALCKSLKIILLKISKNILLNVEKNNGLRLYNQSYMIILYCSNIGKTGIFSLLINKIRLNFKF